MLTLEKRHVKNKEEVEKLEITEQNDLKPTECDNNLWHFVHVC